MPGLVSVPLHIAGFEASPLSRWHGLAPWELSARSAEIVLSIVNDVSRSEYEVCDGIAIHKTATVEPGAVLKGPLVLGAGCFVAAGASLRGSCWIAENCTFGAGMVRRAALCDQEAQELT